MITPTKKGAPAATGAPYVTHIDPRRRDEVVAHNLAHSSVDRKSARRTPTRWVLTRAYQLLEADPSRSLMWHYLTALRQMTAT